MISIATYSKKAKIYYSFLTQCWYEHVIKSTEHCSTVTIDQINIIPKITGFTLMDLIRLTQVKENNFRLVLQQL